MRVFVKSGVTKVHFAWAIKYEKLLKLLKLSKLLINSKSSQSPKCMISLSEVNLGLMFITSPGTIFTEEIRSLFLSL